MLASASDMKWLWLATVTMLAGGCVSIPKQSDPAAGAQVSAGSNEPSASASGDLAQRTGRTTDFHQTATDRQRFQVHIDFGRVFESQGNFEAAVTEYQSALEVAEAKHRKDLRGADQALAHRRMAGALDQLGRFSQAELHYKKALKLDPKDSKIWNDAGYSYYLQGRWKEAEGALKTAAKLAPEDERIRINLGLTLAASGRTEEAMPLLSRSNGDAIGHMNLGYSLAATGQLDLARQQYETALALRPDLDLARRALAQLAHQQGSSPESATNPTRIVRATHPVVDPGVSQASTGRAPSSPPLPSRTLPQAKPPAAIARNTGPPPAINPVRAKGPAIPETLPPLPGS